MEIGTWNELKIDRMKEFGAYLTDGTEDVLLPRKQVPKDAKVGNALTCFVYRDSDDRLIATLTKPYLTVGEIASLEVKDVTGIGAFLDCGLERDLFLPFKEQTTKVQKGKSYPVRMYVDKTGRLACSMRLYEYLKTNHGFKKGEHVKGSIYQVRPGFGAFVAVEDKYSGLIHSTELYDRVAVGDKVEARVRSYGGVLPFDDKADPERIRDEFGLSKNAFKRAVGRLLKEKRIRIENGKIYYL